MSYCIISLMVCTLLDVYMAMDIVTMFYANKVFVLYCIVLYCIVLYCIALNIFSLFTHLVRGGGHSELLPYQCVRHASCVVRRASPVNNGIFFYKTTGPTVLKFHMEHDLTPGSQNYKSESGRISKVAAVTKNSKHNKINFFRTTGYILLNFGMEYQKTKYSKL